MKTMKKIKWIGIGISIVMFLLGLCVLIWPQISAAALCYILSAILLLAGIIRIVSYTQRGISSIFHTYELPLGILFLFMGIFGFARSQYVILILPVVIGILILIDSVFQFQTSFDLKRLGVAAWWWPLILAVLSVLFALLLILNPFEGSRTLMVMLGLSLMIDGIQTFSSILCASKCSKEVRKRSPIDVDFEEIE